MGLVQVQEDLTNNSTVRNRKQPIAAFFAYADVNMYETYLTDNEAIKNISNTYTCQMKLIEYLRKSDYPVVSDKDPRAMDSRSIVVTKSGIQMPFMEPEVARKYIRKLQLAIETSGIARPLGLVQGVTIDQLPPPVLHKQEGAQSLENYVNKQIEKQERIKAELARKEAERAGCWETLDERLNSGRPTRAQPHPKNMYCAPDNGLSWSQKKNYNITANDYEPDMEEEKPQVLEKKEHEEEKYCNFHWSQHPDGGYRDYVSFMYGEDFLERMYNEAKSRAVDMSAEMAKPLNIEDKGQYLYSGRSFATELQTILARNNMESRCGVYATPSLAKACYYAKKCGIVQIYKKGQDQEYYGDYGIERGQSALENPNEDSETIIRSDENEYVGTYLYLGDNLCFKIPENETRWQIFLEFCRTAYLPEEENNEDGINYLAERRKNILREAKQNGNRPKTVVPFGYDIEKPELPQLDIGENLEAYLLTPQTRTRAAYAKYNDLTYNKHRAENDNNEAGTGSEKGKYSIAGLRIKRLEMVVKKDVISRKNMIAAESQEVKEMNKQKRDKNNNRPDITNIKEQRAK